MSELRELHAAGIADPALQAAYARCRALNAEHGRTYFLATRLLPADRRPAIHALYGFARMADDVVDNPTDPTDPAGDDPEAMRTRLEQVRARMRRGLAGEDPRALVADGEPVVAALADTVVRHGIEHGHLEDFMDSMAMDLTITDYATFDDLARYVHGSAAVIGLQVLPVLGTVVPREDAAPHAADLGVAFQVTNFLRDLGEDLDRGRVYLPADELAAFGVDRDRLWHCRLAGRADTAVRRAVAHLVARTRAVYRRAERGIPMLDPASRPCVRTAHVLYGGILDEIEAADYDVLAHRVVVGGGRRAAVALPGLARAVWARRAGRLREAQPQNAMACARRLTSRPRSERSASIGAPGNEVSSAKSHRRISWSA